ncbi:MAG: dihydrofolate reductase family protein, partial [Myxococcota bacterium]
AQPRPVTSLMVEGGGGLAAALVKAGRVDRLRLYVAPRVVGSDGIAAVGPLGLLAMADAPGFEIDSVSRVGDDVRIDVIRGATRAGA